MVVRASALASNSGSYSSTAHAPRRIQFVKLAGACSGSSLSPPRKLLRLSFAGSWFIRPYNFFRPLHFPRKVFPSKTDNSSDSLDSLRSRPLHPRNGVSCRGSQSSGFRIQDKAFATVVAVRVFSKTAPVDSETRLLSRGPKDVVPKRRADAVSDLVILVMMAKMILLQPQ